MPADPVTGPILRPREALECSLYSVDLHPKAKWVIAQDDQGHGVAWRAYKHCYTARKDAYEWVPLGSSYASVSEAQVAIKDYYCRSRPVFCDEKGEILREMMDA